MVKITKEYFGVNIKKCKFLGQGYEGKVYLTPKNEVIKIFKKEIKCKNEYEILKRVEGSKFFPKPIDINRRYMMREFVQGVCLEEYIKEKELSKKLCLSLIELIEEFISLGFTRLDMAARHIYVQVNEEVKVIDPRECYIKNIPFPKLMLSDLDKLKKLDDFLKVLIEVRPSLARVWIAALNN